MDRSRTFNVSNKTCCGSVAWIVCRRDIGSLGIVTFQKMCSTWKLMAFLFGIVSLCIIVHIALVWEWMNVLNGSNGWTIKDSQDQTCIFRGVSLVSLQYIYQRLVNVPKINLSIPWTAKVQWLTNYMLHNQLDISPEQAQSFVWIIYVIFIVFLSW